MKQKPKSKVKPKSSAVVVVEEKVTKDVPKVAQKAPPAKTRAVAKPSTKKAPPTVAKPVVADTISSPQAQEILKLFDASSPKVTTKTNVEIDATFDEWVKGANGELVLDISTDVSFDDALHQRCRHPEAVPEAVASTHTTVGPERTVNTITVEIPDGYTEVEFVKLLKLATAKLKIAATEKSKNELWSPYTSKGHSDDSKLYHYNPNLSLDDLHSAFPSAKPKKLKWYTRMWWTICDFMAWR